MTTATTQTIDNEIDLDDLDDAERGDLDLAIATKLQEKDPS